MTATFGAVAFADLDERARHLVALRQLRGHAHLVVQVPATLMNRPREVRIVDDVPRVVFVVGVRADDVVAAIPKESSMMVVVVVRKTPCRVNAWSSIQSALRRHCRGSVLHAQMHLTSALLSIGISSAIVLHRDDGIVRALVAVPVAHAEANRLYGVRGLPAARANVPRVTAAAGTPAGVDHPAAAVDDGDSHRKLSAASRLPVPRYRAIIG